MEGQSGAQDSTQHDIVLGQRHLKRSQWGRDGLVLIFKLLGNLVGHQLADTLHIVTEKQTVFLDVLVAQLVQKLVDNTVLFRKIDNLHSSNILSLVQRYE